jgi:hypothetical protein
LAIGGEKDDYYHKRHNFAAGQISFCSSGTSKRVLNLLELQRTINRISWFGSKIKMYGLAAIVCLSKPNKIRTYV